MDQELEQFTAIYEQITTFLVNYSFQLIGAVIVLLIGVYVARRISNIVLGLCERKELDVTLSGFIAEFRVGIAYHCDPKKAVQAILDCLKGVEGISTARVPQVGIEGFGASSIDLGVRYWVKTELRHQTQYLANMAIYDALKAAAIEIPFPQREVRMLSDA